MKRELLESEYERIIDYLKALGITDHQMLTEMADHIVIVTEINLAEGMEFEAAFEQAKNQIGEKDLQEINNSAGSFKGYPRFLGKKFLIGAAIILLTLFITGLLMKYNHVPRHRIVIIVARRTISFVLLPMLLLYNLTEYANKTRQVLTFVIQFIFFQTVADYLIRGRINLIFLASGLVAAVIWILLFWLIPKFKNNDIIQK